MRIKFSKYELKKLDEIMKEKFKKGQMLRDLSYIIGSSRLIEYPICSFDELVKKMNQHALTNCQERLTMQDIDKKILRSCFPIKDEKDCQKKISQLYIKMATEPLFDRELSYQENVISLDEVAPSLPDTLLKFRPRPMAEGMYFEKV